MTQPTYSIDRKTASKLLKVSLRTLDRYVKQGSLVAESRNGRIWFSKADIGNFSSRQSRQDRQRRHKGVDNVDTKARVVVDSIPVGGVDNVDSVVKVNGGSKRSSEKILKKLYDEAREKLEEKQERLEAANYRVGQLEAQLKNTVPLLTYEEERAQAQEAQRELKGEVKERDKQLDVAAKTIKEERLNRIIIAGVLFVVLALQPILWFFLQ
jgi:CRISPR/Cas system-associated protein Cas10 (large subunit of type III CRISPR-Cas system)